jgi:hypothetical protein
MTAARGANVPLVQTTKENAMAKGKTRTIDVHGIEFETVGEAIQHWYASGVAHVISVGGRYFAVDWAEANRLEASGVPFAYVHDYPMPDGTYRTVMVPVN